MATTVDQVPERSRMGGDMRRAVGIRETGTHETIRNVGDAPVQSVISGRLWQFRHMPVGASENRLDGNAAGSTSDN